MSTSLWVDIPSELNSPLGVPKLSDSSSDSLRGWSLTTTLAALPFSPLLIHRTVPSLSYQSVENVRIEKLDVSMSSYGMFDIYIKSW